MPDAVEKAYAYATRPGDAGRELLVFEHRDHDAGVQVPGGSVEPGETPVDAAVRELAEEAGVERVRSVEHLGTARWAPPDREAVHRRRFVHVAVREPRDRWTHVVVAGEADEGLAFECRWEPLGDATLDHEMGALLSALR